MDPATIAAVASIGGAAIDFFSGERSARKARKHTKRVATDEAYGSVMGRVEAAKAAGLHPLAALGTPSSSGSSIGGGMSDFRSAATDAVNSYSQQRQWRAEKEFQEAQARDARSQAHNAELRESARLNAELAMNKKQMDFIDEQIRASREESLRRTLQATKPLNVPIRTVAKPPAQAKIPDQYVPVRTRFGEIQYIPNPDLYDLELPSLVGAGTLVKPEIVPAGNFLKRWLDQIDYENRVHRNPKNPYNLPAPIPE